MSKIYTDTGDPRAWTAAKVDAPVDSGEYPVNVFLQGDDYDESSYCGYCLKPAPFWPGAGRMGAPGAIFQADLWCADCQPRSYEAESGELVDTLTGLAI